MRVAAGAPNEIAGGSRALLVLEAAFEDVGLLDVGMHVRAE